MSRESILYRCPKCGIITTLYIRTLTVACYRCGRAMKPVNSKNTQEQLFRAKS